MFAIKPTTPSNRGSGIVWPKSGTSVPDTISDIYGLREFTPHLATKGHSNDMHRGPDVTDVTELRSPITGAVIRRHETHYGWETAYQLTRFAETDPSSAAVFSLVTEALRITGSRVGSVALGSAARLTHLTERMNLAGDWTIECKFAATPAIAGRVGIGVFNPAGTQLAAIEYDGTNVYMFGTDSGGAMTPDGTSVAVASAVWLRLDYTASTTTLTWQTSTNGTSFTTRGSDVAASFTDAATQSWTPRIYYRSVDTSVATDVVDVDEFNWLDDTTIGRFGNWLMICDGTKRLVLLHFESIDANLGPWVTAGQVVGKVGHTGFDAPSGRVTTPHAHFELLLGNSPLYANNDPINPLPYLPRVNGSANVTALRTTANDPLGVSSHKIAVSVERGTDQDFDFNEITLVGGTATRTINLNTRSGLDPADNDNPAYNGVYMVPHAFNQNSTTYEVDFYFNIATVGTFTSFLIRDTQGNTLASG